MQMNKMGSRGRGGREMGKGQDTRKELLNRWMTLPRCSNDIKERKRERRGRGRGRGLAGCCGGSEGKEKEAMAEATLPPARLPDETASKARNIVSIHDKTCNDMRRGSIRSIMK